MSSLQKDPRTVPVAPVSVSSCTEFNVYKAVYQSLVGKMYTETILFSSPKDNGKARKAICEEPDRDEHPRAMAYLEHNIYQVESHTLIYVD